MQPLATYRLSLLLPLSVFLVSGIAAIILQQPWWILVPFAWLLIPALFTYTVTFTEKLFWLVLITLPLSTELNITPSLGIDFPDELLLMLLTAAVIGKMAYQPGWLPRSLKQSSLFFLLVIYLLWLSVTCLFSEEPVLSVKYLLAKIWYIIPFVVLPQVILSSKERISKMALCMVVPMLLVIIQTLVRHSFYGFSFETVSRTVSPFFRNHVNYSSMLVCLLPVSFCIYRLTPTGKPSRKWIMAGMIIGIAALFFAYSRGGWIALPAGICVGWVIRKRQLGKLVIAAIVAIVISVAWLVTDNTFMRFAPDHDRTVFHTDLNQHMLATVQGKDVSTAERWYRWIAGVRMLADKPVTGFGPNSFYLHYRPYTVNRFETWVSNNPEHSTVHNYFILIALEQGVIGWLLFCALFFGMLLATQRLYHRLQSRFYKSIALTIGMILTMIGVINCMSDMIETDKIGGIFWLCLGFIILLEKQLQEEKQILA